MSKFYVGYWEFGKNTKSMFEINANTVADVIAEIRNSVFEISLTCEDMEHITVSDDNGLILANVAI